MPPGSPKQNPTSGTIAVHRSHLVIAGDSLASLAYDEYGDPTMWRPLAAFNGIDDPLRIPEGSAVLLPPPEELLAGR
jgi:nucleoid-associated protein YgaU